MIYVVTIYNSITKTARVFTTEHFETVDETADMLEEGDEMFVNEVGKSKHEDNDE